MNDSYAPKIAIVVPCFNEAAALPHSIPALTEILDNMVASGKVSSDSFVLCVDDGSDDNTWEVVRALNTDDRRVRGISLAHNRGHQSALLAGLMEARADCDAAISIDADLQDDPKAIVDMVDEFINGNEIVFGVRRLRKSDSWFKRNSAHLFYKLQSMMGVHTIYDHADYRLMSRQALDILSEYGEQNLFLRGIVPQIGLKTTTVHYNRHERVAGQSKYTLGTMLAFSIDGITSFTAKPMRWIFLMGLFLLLCDIAVGIYVFTSYFKDNTVSGWTSLMISLWFIASLLFMALGIIGEYIAKIFTETKARPRYNIREKI